MSAYCVSGAAVTARVMIRASWPLRESRREGWVGVVDLECGVYAGWAVGEVGGGRAG